MRKQIPVQPDGFEATLMSQAAAVDAKRVQEEQRKRVVEMVHSGKPVIKTYQPHPDMVAVQVHRLDETEGGLLLADRQGTQDNPVSATEKMGAKDPNRCPTGTVIAVGSGCDWIKEGDDVLIADGAPGTIVIHGGSGAVVQYLWRNVLGVSLVQGGRAKAE